ncbi:MAG: SEL1-like repeat protein, partial [Treponema sp.]|nr:SEL1-like repeat protein [Treponema sp.]
INEVDRILKDAFQSDVVYLPWDHRETFGHSDGIVHFAGDGKVLITNYGDISPRFYCRFRVALEKHFEVIPLYYKTKKTHARSWSYINFLQVGKLILAPQLGLEEDEQALEQISNALPGCEVVGIPSLEAVRRGGALNCISWNVTALQEDIIDETTMPDDAISINTLAEEQDAPSADELFEEGDYYAIREEWPRAVELFTKAAELGHSMAQFNLGLSYELGNGLEKDQAKAIEWYTKAAKQGNECAQYNLAICYEEGSGVEKDMRKAVKWYKESAELGFAPAQYNLAICYEEGTGIKKNMRKAVELYMSAAKQGIAFAQYKLAVCYRKGLGIEKNLVMAAKYYAKAANQDDPLAQNDLGACYANGDGVKQDFKKAVRWYKKGAAQGEEHAQFNLAKCYEEGQGVKKDLEKAEAWYTMSASQGYKKAKER